MAELVEQLILLPESSNGRLTLFIAHEALAHLFDSDITIALLCIDSPVDGAHTTAPGQGSNEIVLVQQRMRRQSAG